jgi:hypothetical protein
MMVSNCLSIQLDLFDKLLDLWEEQEMNVGAEKSGQNFYDLYEQVLSKLDKEQTKIFFDKFFTKIECLKKLSEGSFQLFRSCSIRLNEFYDNIQRKYTYCYSDVMSMKK